MYFNCYKNILVKYNFLPYKIDGIREIHNKMWKIPNSSVELLKHANFVFVNAFDDGEHVNDL